MAQYGFDLLIKHGRPVTHSRHRACAAVTRMLIGMHPCFDWLESNKAYVSGQEGAVCIKWASFASTAAAQRLSTEYKHGKVKGNRENPALRLEQILRLQPLLEPFSVKGTATRDGKRWETTGMNPEPLLQPFNTTGNGKRWGLTTGSSPARALSRSSSLSKDMTSAPTMAAQLSRVMTLRTSGLLCPCTVTRLAIWITGSFSASGKCPCTHQRKIRTLMMW